MAFQLIAAELITGQLQSDQLANGSVTAAQLAANAVTAPAIHPGAVTFAALAAGIVYAGIVDATTIKAAQYIADGTTGEFLAYSGPPTLGNLIAAVSGANSTDGLGNSDLEGVSAFSGNTAVNLNGNAVNWFRSVSGDMVAGAMLWDAIDSVMRSEWSFTHIETLFSGSQHVLATSVIGAATTAALLEIQGAAGLVNSSAPAAVSTAAIAYASNGSLHVIDADGQDYQTEQKVLTFGGGTFTTTTTIATVTTGNSKTYAFQFRIQFNGSIGTDTINMEVATTGTIAGTPEVFATVITPGASFAAAVVNSGPLTLNTLTTGPIFSTSQIMELVIRGHVGFTGAGSIAFELAPSGGNLFTKGGELIVWPV